jgi:protein gp37
MSKSPIEWTGETWNPTVGCSRKSAGCENCYAEKLTKRLAAMGNKNYEGLLNEHDRFNGVLRLNEDNLLKPLTIKKPTTFFVNSMSDLFHENVKDEWIDKVFAVMALCPQHTFQILTKRAERMKDYVETLKNYSDVLSQFWMSDALENLYGKHIPGMGTARIDKTLPNVWLGVSVENQKEKHRIDLLRQTSAAVRFLSLEPLLEYLGELDLTNVDWVIVGGESGPKARPFYLEYAADIIRQCKAAKVPVFFKQAGAFCVTENVNMFDFPPDVKMLDWGTSSASARIKLKKRKGNDLNELPEDFYIRQLPNELYKLRQRSSGS